MGVLSTLPIINVLNACCCLWVVAGGLIAAYLLQENRSTPITAGDGAFVGLLAGIAGAFIATIVSIPLSILVGPMERAMLERLTTGSSNFPPEVRELFENMADQQRNVGLIGQIVGRIIALCFMLFVGAIFSTFGGLLGAVLFAKKSASAQ